MKYKSELSQKGNEAYALIAWYDKIYLLWDQDAFKLRLGCA